jgi:hypothetical protein
MIKYPSLGCAWDLRDVTKDLLCNSFRFYKVNNKNSYVAEQIQMMQDVSLLNCLQGFILVDSECE